MRNKVRYNKETVELDRLLEEERQYELDKREALEKEEIESKRRKIMEKEALIDELMFSESDAKEILNYFAESKTQAKKEAEEASEKQQQIKKESRKINYFSTGLKIGDSNQLYGSRSLAKIEEGPMYVYTEPTLVIDGPPFPLWTGLETAGYLKHVRQETVDERAGGYFSSLACMRALQEAMCGLYNISKKVESV